MRLTACRIAVALALATSACGSSPQPVAPDSTSPTNPLAEGGAWTLLTRVDSCTSTRSECPTSAVGTLMEVALQTIPVGSALDAVFTSHSALINGVPVQLSGQLQSDGSARYSGSYNAESPTTSLRGIDVTELLIRPDDRSGLSGTLSIVQRNSVETRSVRATLLSASRQPFPETDRPFQGEFEGFGTVRSCLGTCPSWKAGDRMTVSLRLTQAGSAVSGEFGVIAVSGTANGRTLTLAGEDRAPLDQEGLGTTLSRIESFSTSIDSLGRLSGAFRLYDEGVYDSQPGAAVRFTPFAETVDVELTTVIRQ